jgi:Kef-type K+ transport system membrane component KefB
MMRFAVILFLMLSIPSLSKRLRMPSCVGFIIAGIVVGPNGIGIVPKHAEVALAA